MPVEPTPSTDVNFGWRQNGRPKGWVDDPITVTDSDGVTYQLTVLADENGDVMNPVSTTDLFDATTTTNELLADVIFLLKSMAEQ